MRKHRHVTGWARGAMLAALLVANARAAAARDVATGSGSCALGPVGAGADPGDRALVSSPFGMWLVDFACPFLWHGPLLPTSPWLSGPSATGAGVMAWDLAADLQIAGPPPPTGGSAAMPPARREGAIPGARADVPREPLWGVISEVRVGALAHDVVFPSSKHLNAPNPFHHHFERGMNLNGEILFVSPGLFHVIGSPRPRLGGSVNTLGYTSNAYVDLDWRYQFAVGPFFEGFLGGAVHDGRLLDGNPEFAELGTRFLFHLGLEAGFRFQGRHGLSLFWEHMSNSALARKNQGMDSTGVRYGYRFGD